MTTTPRKRPAAAKRAPARPRPPVGIEAPVGAINLDALPQAAPDKTVHLFTLDGVDYYVPAKPRANVSLQYLRMARNEGEISAGGWLLEEMLGEEAYTALAGWDGLTTDVMSQLMGAVTKLVMGSVEDTTRPLGRG